LAESNKFNRIARGINVLLGSWLFLSAFLWEHGGAQRTNTAIVGVLIASLALVAMSAPAVRWLNTILSFWLFVSVWALPHHSLATMFNNAVVALVVLEVTLVSAGDDHRDAASGAAG
jgi:hypothetical protein